MQFTSQTFTLFFFILFISVTSTKTFAEPAPVYDAETLSQQVDDELDQQDILPPPPDQEGTFVPMPPPKTSQQVQRKNPSIQQTQPNPDAQLFIADRSNANMTLEQRIYRVEQQIDNMQENDLAARTDSLQNQLQALRDEIEILTHKLQEIQSQKQAEKTTAAETNTTANANATSNNALAKNNHKVQPKTVKTEENVEENTVVNANQTNEGQPNVAEEQQIYQTAYNLIKAKKYNEAVNALQSMLQKYPSGQFASNAHYWLGELYGVMGKNDQALNEFSIVVRSYPDSPRVSDAQLKVGIIYAAQLKWKDAKIALKKVINRYPGTTSARLAAEQLKQIRQTGH